MSEGNKDYCRVGAAGYLFMDAYDGLHSRIRALLREAPYNLCVACITERACDIAHEDEVSFFDSPNLEPIYQIRAIEEFIRDIREMGEPL